MSSPSIHFVINTFSHSYNLSTLATVDDPIHDTLDVSATSVFYISQNDIQQVFQIHTDSADMTDASTNDLLFLTFMDRWPTTTVLNPVNGMMDQYASSNALLQVGIADKMLVKHDFIRYLASELFNTAQGADLFNNESALITGLNALGEYAYQTDISSGLWKYATTSRTPTNGTSFVIDPITGLKAATAHNTEKDNLGFLITNQLLMTYPERFNNIHVDGNGLFPAPILAGDTFLFATRIDPAPRQNELTGVPPFGGRTYQIKLIVDDGSHINTTPTD